MPATVWFEDDFNGPGPALDGREVQYQASWFSKGPLVWTVSAPPWDPSEEYVSEGSGKICEQRFNNGHGEPGPSIRLIDSSGEGYAPWEQPRVASGLLQFQDIELPTTIPADASYPGGMETVWTMWFGYDGSVLASGPDTATHVDLIMVVDLALQVIWEPFLVIPDGETPEAFVAALAAAFIADLDPGWEATYPNLESEIINGYLSFIYYLNSLTSPLVNVFANGIGYSKNVNSYPGWVDGTMPGSPGQVHAQMLELIAHPQYQTLVASEGSTAPPGYEGFTAAHNITIQSFWPFPSGGVCDLEVRDDRIDFNGNVMPWPEPIGTELSRFVNDTFQLNAQTCLGRYYYEVDVSGDSSLIGKRHILNRAPSTVGGGLAGVGQKLKR